jgi:hypothetical protein
MEQIIYHCENFFKLLDTNHWLAIANKEEKTKVIDNAFKYGKFIKELISKIRKEQELWDTVKEHEKLTNNLLILKYPCETLLFSIFDFTQENDGNKDTLELAISAYAVVVGTDQKDFNSFVSDYILARRFSQIAIKMISRICMEPGGEQFHQIVMKNCIENIEQLSINDTTNFSDHTDNCLKQLVLQNTIGLESLLTLCLQSKQEELKMKILNFILEKSTTLDDNNKKIWNNFIKIDQGILIKIFSNHSWFFEEFFEFLMHSAQYFKCDYGSEKCVWQGNTWLTYQELVEFIQKLWFAEDVSVRNYVKQVIAHTKGQPIWQDVKQNMPLGEIHKKRQVKIVRTNYKPGNSCELKEQLAEEFKKHLPWYN